nr:MG2 domain-containing protein [Ignavibacterium sp.]
MKSIQKRGIIFLTAVFITTFFAGGSTRLPVTDKNENFYLSNYTTFAPGDIARINLYSYSNSSQKFDFKLLRIDDPIRFFSLIDQNNSRYAFDIWGKDKALLLKYTSLVKEWDYKPVAKNNYQSGEIGIGKIDEAGIYIVQAIRNDKVSYCAIVVTDYALVYKNNHNLSDFEGITNSNIQLFGHSGEEVILSDPYFYFNNNQSEYLTAYIYTQQPVYRPGQEVNFKAIFRNKKGNEIINTPDMKFEVAIKSPKNKEVYAGEATTNEFGSLSGNFLLDGEADLGYYSIVFTKNGVSYYGSFTVEEYKKPEYKVNVSTDRNQYANGDKIAATVSADYYFGSPVKEASVQIS